MPFRVTRQSRSAVVGLTLLFVLAAGCTDDTSTSSPGPEAKTSSSPVVDSSPYWCDFLPQQAVRTITGLSITIEERKTGVPTTHGQCALRNDYDRLSLVWSVRDGDGVLDTARENFGDRQLATLPENLGTGLIAYTARLPRSRPYYTMMLFRCGKKRPWISVDLSEVREGRDPVSDLIELLTIARERYGQLHRCTPTPI
ncbi:hypothetical protein OUY22_01195 [Nonomuraea sp. MCN248]|uniref:DUF3558 domain-containing protein n=1 Tax=Nonomuraea corallina TaxID=2989783 RepID=A0ABT4S4A4_9ACTN|nr:hypothetical protein [Nonomuraea corallina]MDA0632014.1 hypothetical protein [Nonomuraea corallina]